MQMRLRVEGAYSDHGKLSSTRHLKHVKIAVAVAGIERFDRHCYQEIALSSMANALAPRRVAHPIELMQGMSHMISERRFLSAHWLSVCATMGIPEKQEG